MRLTRHAMCALMPRSGALPGLADTDVDGYLRALRREGHPIFRLGLLAGALVFVLTPVLTVGIPLPSVLLSPAQLERHAARIVDTRHYLLRQALLLLRLNAGLCWGADPHVRARFALTPYPPDPGTFRQA